MDSKTYYASRQAAVQMAAMLIVEHDRLERERFDYLDDVDTLVARRGFVSGQAVA